MKALQVKGKESQTPNQAISNEKLFSVAKTTRKMDGVSENIVKSGKLLKRGEIVKSMVWNLTTLRFVVTSVCTLQKVRFFKLTPTQLQYFEDENAPAPLASIDLSKICSCSHAIEPWHVPSSQLASFFHLCLFFSGRTVQLIRSLSFLWIVRSNS